MFENLTKIIWLAIVIVIVFALSAMVDLSGVSADSLSPAESVPTSLCHDPLLGPSMVIYSPACDMGNEKSKDSDSPVVNPVTTVDSSTVTIIPQPEDETEETPAEETQPESGNGNNGNHYGNDKPDNNPNDVKNPHNGENTYDDHHDNE